MNTNPKNIVTLPNSGKELIRADTNCLILGIALMLFKGLITLTTLSALKLTDIPPSDPLVCIDAINSTTPETAIKKSTIFHVSLI